MSDYDVFFWMMMAFDVNLKGMTSLIIRNGHKVYKQNLRWITVYYWYFEWSTLLRVSS